MTMTRDSERHFFVDALRARYGFGPAECEVHILESSGDGGRIAAEIGGKSYILENLYKLNGEDIYDDLREYFAEDLFSEKGARDEARRACNPIYYLDVLIEENND